MTNSITGDGKTLSVEVPLPKGNHL